MIAVPDLLRRSSAAIVLLAALPGASLAQTPAIGADELVRRLGTLADSLARHDALSGVVLLARNGAPVFERAYGYADREARRANEIGTAFNISSIGKRFTQIAIAQLVAAGKLNLDATIESVWPDYPNHEVARQVTVRQLLMHRSGIGGNIFQRVATLDRNRDYLPLFVNEPLHFPPGTREEYSNAGYIVLGEIVARVSGDDYYDYVRKHVFDLAGMTHAGFFSRDSLPSFGAIGYTMQLSGHPATSANGPLARADSLQPRRGSAGGGAYASARDLLNFVVARRAGRLGVATDGGQEITAGGSPGSNGVVAELLPGGYDLIVLENLDPPAADAIVAPVMRWLGVPTPSNGRRMIAGAPSRPVGGAIKLPNSPVGRVAADYLRAYNSGDPDTVRSFLEREGTSDPSHPTAARIERYKSIFAENGRLELISIDDASPTTLTITVNGGQGSTLSMEFVATATDPPRLTSLRLNMTR